ncbi:hypothetical protein H8959_017618 [Pygathrix nigripes]
MGSRGACQDRSRRKLLAAGTGGSRRRVWGKGGSHTRKSVREGGGNPRERGFRRRKGCRERLPANLPWPLEGPPLPPLRLPRSARPSPFQQRQRRTCCEAAARVSEGWFGRGGGNGCWRRRQRQRGLGLYRAEPAGYPPGTAARPVPLDLASALTPLGTS